MLKIDSNKIWELLKKDKEIQKELLKYIHEEKEKLEEYQAIYQAQVEVVENLKEKKEKLKQKRAHIEDEMTRKNGDISFLEIRKYFLEKRLQRLIKIEATTKNKKKQQKFQKRIKEVQEDILNINEKQELISYEIANLENDKDYFSNQIKDCSKEISDNLDILEEDQKNVSYWQEQYDIKMNRFYHASYDEVTGYFKPCQDLVVPHLEEEKKMSKEAAKEKANPIIIDEEKILEPPEKNKARRLTKEEKEEYRKDA